MTVRVLQVSRRPTDRRVDAEDTALVDHAHPCGALPGTMYGVSRDTPKREIMRRQSEAYGSH